MMKSLIIITGISFLLFISCNNATNKPETDTEAITTDGVSFSKDIQPLFDRDCVSCHEYLESNVAYKMLTTHNSSSVGSSQYIDTLNPTKSFLYTKLLEEPPCGASMAPTWTDEEKDLVLRWIKEGAKNN